MNTDISKLKLEALKSVSKDIDLSDFYNIDIDDYRVKLQGNFTADLCRVLVEKGIDMNVTSPNGFVSGSTMTSTEGMEGIRVEIVLT